MSSGILSALESLQGWGVDNFRWQWGMGGGGESGGGGEEGEWRAGLGGGGGGWWVGRGGGDTLKDN